MENTGLQFYKKYFEHLEFEVENGKIKPVLNETKTKEFLDKFFSSKLPTVSKELILGNTQFELTTIYPGLLIGSGYNHEIGEQKNELKLGFFFDYTTGLPCIPGSSVKGVLRNACEINKGDYVVSILNELLNGERKTDNKNIVELLNENSSIYELFKGKYSCFVMNVFDGKAANDEYLPLKQRDIFFDAFPIVSKNKNGIFLANDYITPHNDQFKNPNPIQFLKILPQVTFKFNFDLSDTFVTKEIKAELFKQILLDLGIGAKRNVGYGQFQ